MDILLTISDLLQKGKATEVQEQLQLALDRGVSPNDALKKGLVAGMGSISRKFKNNEIFVPEVLVAARAMNIGLEILEPALAKSEFKTIGTAVVCTVLDDMHDIGKNLVKIMLTGQGFACTDLGINVHPDSVVEAIQKYKPDIVCLSALLTSTMVGLKNTIAAITAAGLRDQVKIMVGGAPVTQDYADYIGADAYAPDAEAAALLARSLIVQPCAALTSHPVGWSNLYISTKIGEQKMFKELPEYKPDLDKTISVMSKTYQDALQRKGGNVTFRALPPSDVDFYEKFDLTRFNYEDDIDVYAAALSEKLSRSFDLRKDIDDNMIPTISPVLGIGDYSAFVAGEIRFMPDTSWSTPVLKEIEDYKAFPPLGSAKWYGKFMAICEALLKLSHQHGIPFMRGFFSPLDLAGALRGDLIYYDFYDAPQELHGLLNYCTDATIQFAEDIYSLARKYLGQSQYGMWYLDGIINMSEDIACMISGDFYRKFAAPYTQRVIDHFGTGHLHSHSRAMYLVKEICSLNNVANLWLATDPNQPRPMERLDQLVEDANGVCLAIDCESFAEIENNIDKLRRGNFSICLPCSSVEEGLEAVEKFKRF